MNSNLRKREGILPPQPNPRIELRRTIAIADGDHRHNSGLACACDHLLAVGVELLTIEMGVRVDEHRKAGFGRQGKWIHVGQPPRLSGERSSRFFTLAVRLTEHLPENWPGPACRLQETQRQSCRSTPGRASSAGRDLPLSRLFGLRGLRARRLLQFPPELGGLRSRCRFPGARA